MALYERIDFSAWKKWVERNVNESIKKLKTLSAKVEVLENSTSTVLDVTLLSSGWGSDFKQVVNVEGITSTKNITIIVPANRTEYLRYGEAIISCIEQGQGNLTFQCSAKPAINLTIKVEISN